MMLLRDLGVQRSDGAAERQAIGQIEDHPRPAGRIADRRVCLVLLEGRSNTAHAPTDRRKFPRLAAGLEKGRGRHVQRAHRRIPNGATRSALTIKSSGEIGRAHV